MSQAKAIRIAKLFIFIGIIAVVFLALKDSALAANANNLNINSDLQESSALKTVWKAMLGISNLTVLIILIAVGFSTIFSIQVDTYHIKKAIIPIMVGIIMANFSLMICNVFLDVSNILTVNFRNNIVADAPEQLGSKEAYALRRVFMPQQTISFISRNKNKNAWELAGWKWRKGVKTEYQVIAIGGVLAFLLTGGVTAGIILVIIFGILLLLPALAVWALGILFYARTWMLFFLIAISPLAFLGISWAPTQTLFKRWWNQFLLWTFMVPIAYFFFWLAVFVHKSIGDASEFNLGSYMAGLVLLWLAVVTPFKLGGAVGGVLGGVMKKVGGAAAGWGARAGWATYNRTMEARLKDKERAKLPRWRRIIAPRMPSWRNIPTAWKEARARLEQESTAEPTAIAQEFLESYMRGHWFRGGKLFQKGQSDATRRLWAQRLREKAQEFSGQGLGVEGLQAALQGNTPPEDIQAMALALVSEGNTLDEETIEAIKQKTGLSGDRASSFDNMIRRSNIAMARNEQDYATATRGKKREEILHDDTVNQAALISGEGDVEKIISLLAQIANEHNPDFEGLDSATRQAAEAELGYYNDNRDNPDLIKSFVIGDLMKKGQFTGADLASARQVGMGPGFQEVVRNEMSQPTAVKKLRDGAGRHGNAFIQGVAKMANYTGAFGYDRHLHHNAGVAESVVGETRKINQALAKSNIDLVFQPVPVGGAFNLEKLGFNEEVKKAVKQASRAADLKVPFQLDVKQPENLAKLREAIKSLEERIGADLAGLSHMEDQKRVQIERGIKKLYLGQGKRAFKNIQDIQGIFGKQYDFSDQNVQLAMEKIREQLSRRANAIEKLKNEANKIKAMQAQFHKDIM